MKCFHSASCFASSIGASLIFVGSFSASALVAADASPTTQGVTTPIAIRTHAEIMGDISSDEKIVNELLGKNSSVLKNAADRRQVAPTLIPAMQKMRIDLEELATAEPRYSAKVSGMQSKLIASLSILGDKESSDRIKLLVSSKDPSSAITGQIDNFLVGWMVADKTVVAQTPLIDDLEKLDKAHTESVPLTVLTAQLSRDAASAELTARLRAIASDEMDNPGADAIKQQFATKKAASDKLIATENKPLTIAGTTIDGKAFSSANLKGKVVLVDFWATWCGPCKKELPRARKCILIIMRRAWSSLEFLTILNSTHLTVLYPRRICLGRNCSTPTLLQITNLTQ